MVTSKFIREKVTCLGILGTFATYVGAVGGLHYFYTLYWDHPETSTVPMVWAASITLGVYAFFGLLNYCWFAQGIKQDEINRIAAVRARLEAQVVKKRQSSKKRKQKVTP